MENSLGNGKLIDCGASSNLQHKTAFRHEKALGNKSQMGARKRRRRSGISIRGKVVREIANREASRKSR